MPIYDSREKYKETAILPAIVMLYLQYVIR